MSAKPLYRSVAVAAVLVLLAGAACADTIVTVAVGNTGNTADNTGYGAVDYAYEIGMYEVTAGQYAEFLNAVARTSDAYGLYNTQMWNNALGCKIQRTGSPGAYTYEVVDPDRADRPVNYVSWGDAARFVNWLSNGKPTTGSQTLATTEDGSYYLNGATLNTALMAVTRKATATWVIPTEDEWYKAAYHKNDGDTGNYWDYPTGTNALPNNGNPGGDTGNTANFFDGDHTVGSPYYTTPVGTFGLSDSPYGTFDQGGNLFEWNETAFSASQRGMRGGTWSYASSYLAVSTRSAYTAKDEEYYIGFRVVAVPEPGTLAMLAGIAVMGLAFWRRRRV